MLSAHYPRLKLLGPKDIAKIEPAVAYSKGARCVLMKSLPWVPEDEYTAVISRRSRALSCVRLAHPGKDVKVVYNQRCCISTGRASCSASRLAMPATRRARSSYAPAAYSPNWRTTGYGHRFSVLPVAGSCYFTRRCSGAKVYAVQNDKLPFAAIHGDPDVMVPGKTRWGPDRARAAVLERYNWDTLKDFLMVFKFDRKVWDVLYDLLKVADIRNYMLKTSCSRCRSCGECCSSRMRARSCPT